MIPSRWLISLTILLLLQLLAIGFLFNQPEQQPSPSLLGSIKGQSIQAIELSANHNLDGLESSSMRFEKHHDQWQIKPVDGPSLLANQQQLTAFIEKLGRLELGLPVAYSDQAAERFEVADNRYQRKLSIYPNLSEDATIHFYLGTSPGYQQTHLRIQQQADIYAVKLSNFDIPAKPSDWLDKKQLAIASSITHIITEDYALRYQDSQWSLTTAKTSQPIQQQRAKQLVSHFNDLKIDQLSDLNSLQNPRIIEVSSLNEQYRFALAEQADNFYIQRDDGAIFSISQEQFEGLLTPIFDDSSQN